MYSLDYVGGFFDGEGCVGLYKQHRGNNFHLSTQLTQNKSVEADKLFDYLVNKYGGSVGEQITSTQNIKLNWQVSGNNLEVFLRDLLPSTHYKRIQIMVALFWLGRRPILKRGCNGRIVKHLKEWYEFSEKCSRLLMGLKKMDLKKVMDNQKDLVDIVTELRHLVAIKGLKK